jgi:hypothetical protein
VWFSGGENARLKVRFVGDCWIIGLMRRATHGHWWITLPDDSFERNPLMSEELYKKIVGIAVSKGYSAERIPPHPFPGMQIFDGRNYLRTLPWPQVCP